MKLDHATEEFISGLGTEVGEAFSTGSIEDIRKVVQTLGRRNGPGPALYSVEDLDAASSGAVVPVRVMIPIAKPLGLIVYYHPGGFIAGTIDDFDTVARKLAERTSFVVVVVGYRLAPEHPYPAAVDDSFLAFEWAFRERETWGIGHSPVIVFGEGSGADLATITARRARDAVSVGSIGRGVDLQILVGPILNTANPDEPSGEGGGLIGLPAFERIRDWYLPDPSRRVEADASPLDAPDLRGLPTTVLIIPELDPLVGRAMAYATRLRESGVDVVERRHAGQLRGFFGLLELRYGEKAVSQIVQAVVGCAARYSVDETHARRTSASGSALERLVSN